MATGMALGDLISALECWRKDGELRYSTASNLRGACDRVLGTMDPRQVEDVDRIDVDHAIDRFQRENPEVSEASVRMYKSRVEKAIELFVQYHRDPVNWKQAIKQRSPRTTYVVPSPPPTRPSFDDDPYKDHLETPSNTIEMGPQLTSEETLSIPFPLRPDATIRISGLPRDLTSDECERISAFLRPLATDYNAASGT